MKPNKFVFAIASTLALISGSAQAMFINGAIDASGRITNTPALPSNSIVTALATVSTGGLQVGNGTGDIPSTLLGSYSFTVDATPAALFTSGGFTFTVLNWGTKVVTNFGCGGANTQCADQVSYTGVSGSVDDGVGGFDATLFSLGTFQYSGTCNTVGGTQCDNNVVAGWRAVFAAQGVAAPPTVPEPASLALVGLALAGVGFSARRRAAK